jgi:hypothetical protein
MRKTSRNGRTLGVERMSENVYIVLGSVDSVSVVGFLEREFRLEEAEEAEDSSIRPIGDALRSALLTRTRRSWRTLWGIRG